MEKILIKVNAGRGGAGSKLLLYAVLGNPHLKYFSNR